MRDIYEGFVRFGSTECLGFKAKHYMQNSTNAGVAVTKVKDILGDPVSQTVDILKAEIVSGALTPGEPLRQEHLAKRFGLSRMPIREAITRLQLTGFVTVEPNKRACVAPVSQADFLEIYDTRIALETLALKTAIPHLTDSIIDQAAAVQARIETADLQDFGPLNMAFHTTLYRPSARPRLLALIDNFGECADRYMFMVAAGHALHEKSNREHHVLLDACRKRDTDAAVTCLKGHIEDARDTFAPLLRS